jgi:hypothetical protein
MPEGLSSSPSDSMVTLPSPHSPSEATVDVFLPTPPNLSPSSRPAMADDTEGLVSAPRPEPFLFGSPLPQHRLSNHDFGKAASSVLDEMNNRLGLSGDQKVGMDIFINKKKSIEEVNRKETIKDDKFGFDKVHEQAFKKMDSIASHYAARRGNPVRNRVPPVEDDGVLMPRTRKRKSEALDVDDCAAQKTNDAGVDVNNMIPGGFGVDENDDGRRLSKRIRTTDHDVRVKTDEEIIRKNREIETVRRKAEARRRSSRVNGINTGLARQSVGKGTKGRTSLAKSKNSELIIPSRLARCLMNFEEMNKGSTSRFGFLSSAKNLIKNVWKGVGSTAAKSATPSIARNIPANKPLKPKLAFNPVSSTSSKAKVVTTSQPSVLSKASTKSNAVASSSSRSNGSRFGFGWANSSVASSSTVSKAGFSIGASSLGQKPKQTINTAGSSTRSSTASNTGGGSKRPSSTLMAPTASSLAKRQSVRLAPRNRHDSHASLQAKDTSISSVANNAKPVLSTITNNHYQDTPARIFNEPLTTTTFSSASKIPVPISAKPVVDSKARTSKPRSHIPHKPRISRSRVIAKLGAQRVTASVGPVAKRSSLGSGKIRSSLGNDVRKSYGGVKTRTSGGSDALLGAKKKARASEYARRRSRVQRKEPIDVKVIDELIQ